VVGYAYKASSERRG